MSRDAARAFGTEMPASRVIVNSPTTHGAIGFSTALPPSMTLGCGSWGGNVTSDNVSPWHLMDIKRVAFETRAVPSKRPARAAQQPAAASPLQPLPAPAGVAAGAGRTGAVSRDDIAKIVDRFLSQRQPAAPQPSAQPLPVVRQPHTYVQQDVDVEPQRVAHSGGAAPHPEAAPTAQSPQAGGNGGGASAQPTPAPAPPAPTANDGGRAPAPKQTPSPAASNGKRAVDFVCEDDVRRAIQKGEKIYVGARTIITPAARDMGEAAEVFAKA